MFNKRKPNNESVNEESFDSFPEDSEGTDENLDVLPEDEETVNGDNTPNLEISGAAIGGAVASALNPIGGALEAAAVAGIGAVGAGLANRITRTATKMTSKIESTLDGGGSGGKIFDVKPPFSGGGSNVPPGGPPSSGSGNFYSGTPFYNLDYNAKPVEIRLDTGIKPNCYTPLYKDAVDGYSSPMHLTLCAIDVSDSIDSTSLYNFFNRVMATSFLNHSQAAVSFSVNASLFSGSNLIDYFNAILYALQVYYFFDSIIILADNPGNRNEAISAIRANLSASDLQNIYALRRNLCMIPIPPNMLKLAYYLSQNYRSSDLADSPIIKICPVVFNNGFPSTSAISDSMLALANFRELSAILSRACPNWINPNLPHSLPEAAHDPNFTTIWINLPYSAQNAGVSVIGPSVSTLEESIRYNTMSDTLDGLAYSLTGIYQNSKWQPTLIKPLDNPIEGRHSNRLSWFISSGVRGFYDATIRVDLVFNRNETHSICWPVFNNAVQKSHFNGSERVYGVSAMAVTETAYEVIEWLLSFNSFTVDKKISDKGFKGLGAKSFKGGSSSNTKRTKRKSKSKSKSEDKED